MTPKQERFVQEYLIDLNATAAAIRAGYSAKTAHVQANQLLKKPLVFAAIRAAQSKTAEKFTLTQEMVLTGLLTEAERMGEGTSHSARVSAWTQLGKHSSLAMWRDVLKIEDTISEIPDAALEDIATGGRSRAPAKTNGAAKPDSVH